MLTFHLHHQFPPPPGEPGHRASSWPSPERFLAEYLMRKGSISFFGLRTAEIDRERGHSLARALRGVHHGVAWRETPVERGRTGRGRRYHVQLRSVDLEGIEFTWDYEVSRSATCSLLSGSEANLWRCLQAEGTLEIEVDDLEHLAMFTDVWEDVFCDSPRYHDHHGLKYELRGRRLDKGETVVLRGEDRYRLEDWHRVMRTHDPLVRALIDLPMKIRKDNTVTWHGFLRALATRPTHIQAERDLWASLPKGNRVIGLDRLMARDLQERRWGDYEKHHDTYSVSKVCERDSHTLQRSGPPFGQQGWFELPWEGHRGAGALMLEERHRKNAYDGDDHDFTRESIAPFSPSLAASAFRIFGAATLRDHDMALSRRIWDLMEWMFDSDDDVVTYLEQEIQDSEDEEYTRSGPSPGKGGRSFVPSWSGFLSLLDSLEARVVAERLLARKVTRSFGVETCIRPADLAEPCWGRTDREKVYRSSTRHRMIGGTVLVRDAHLYERGTHDLDLLKDWPGRSLGDVVCCGFLLHGYHSFYDVSPSKGGGEIETYLPFSASIARAAQEYFDSSRLKDPDLKARVDELMGQVLPQGLGLRDQMDEVLEEW